jgi:hypothetical protein
MYRLVTFAVLLVLALVVFFAPGLTSELAGYKPLGTIGPEEIDEPSSFDERAAPRFFAERNQVELVVPRDTTLGELLRLYQVDFPHVRRQIAEQKGVENMDDGDRIAEGERFELTLTPPAEGQP